MFKYVWAFCRHLWVKTTHRRLKVDTIIKISVRDCLNFLKNTKKLMKIFFRKCPKFVSTPFFCISKSFGYFYQRKIIHNIGVCVQSWPIVDQSQVLILLCIEKDRLGVADVTPLVCTILMIVQIFLIIERFSSSMSWNVLQISQKSTGADCLKIAGMRWS